MGLGVEHPTVERQQLPTRDRGGGALADLRIRERVQHSRSRQDRSQGSDGGDIRGNTTKAKGKRDRRLHNLVRSETESL